MDFDMSSEDGELKRTPEKEYYSEEEGTETTDSLEIKPPQVVVRHRKSTSSHRRDKYSRHSYRDDKERFSGKSSSSSSRHHGSSGESKYDDRDSKSSRHRTDEKTSRRSDKQERDFSRYDKNERNTNYKIEDLREKLLDKHRERREYKTESLSSLQDRNDTKTRESRCKKRKVHLEDVEGQQRSSRHIRLKHQESYSEVVEIIDPLQRSSMGREKRHKRSHKHEKIKRNQELENMEMNYHDDQIREHQQSHELLHVREQQTVEDYKEERMKVMTDNEYHQILSFSKDPKDMTEQELRRQKFIEANREMARIKENSRLELEARRKIRDEKQQKSPETLQYPFNPSITNLSDESVHKNDLDRSSNERSDSRGSEDRSSSDSSSSSSSTSTSDDDDDDSTDSKESNDSNDYNNVNYSSPNQLANKLEKSDGDSNLRVESNGNEKPTNNNSESKTDDNNLEIKVNQLPAYIPAIQGCRSVEEYMYFNRIAEGTYGVVYRAEDKRTKEVVALKRLKMEKERDGFPITSLREINTLLKAQHPNIVTVREIVVGASMDKIFIVMDYVEHDLKSLMETMKAKNHAFVPGEIKCLMKQLLAAVAHLHDNWILHRDLKTSNLLLSHKGVLKVGDFGLAREYGSPLKQYTSLVVTLWYRAPELLLGSKEYSTPIDMWSVGCIFAELIRMDALFAGKSEIEQINKIFKELGTPNDKTWPNYSQLSMVKKISFAQYGVNNLRQRFGLSLSDNGIELLIKFLTYDPSQRITADKALEHPYFSETPLPIDPAMFPTWPAKSEGGIRKSNASPKPPSGGKEFKTMKENESEESTFGFHMGTKESNRQLTTSASFHLRFWQ